MSNSQRSTHALCSRLLCSYLQIGRLLLFCSACPMVLDLPRQTHEGLLHVTARLRTHFQEEHVVLVSQFLRFLLLHFAFIHQISLSANEDLTDCLAGVAFDLLDPAANILEGLLR